MPEFCKIPEKLKTDIEKLLLDFKVCHLCNSTLKLKKLSGKHGQTRSALAFRRFAIVKIH